VKLEGARMKREITRGEVELILILELRVLTGIRGPASPGIGRVRVPESDMGMVRAKRGCGLRLPEGFAR